jgi:hypothetical protein
MSPLAVVTVTDKTGPVLQIACRVSKLTPSGVRCLQVNVFGKGLASIGADFCLDVQTLTLNSLSTAANTTVLSAYGATPITVHGHGFDATNCTRNNVSMGDVPCIVTDCAVDRLLATFPGTDDAAAQQTNLNATFPGVPQSVVVEVLGTSSSSVARANLSGALTVSSGGADAPYCAIVRETPSNGTANATLGSRATLKAVCSTAAREAGVMSLHLVLSDVAGIATAADDVGDESGSRRLRQGGRRLRQEPSNSVRAQDDASTVLEDPPVQPPIPCRVREFSFSPAT